MSNDANLQDNVIVVTGAGGGIGLAVCQRLGAAGASVVMMDMKPAPAAAVENAEYRQGDVTDERFVAGVFDEIAARSDPLRGLVNAAGVLWFDRDRSILDMDLSVWDQVLDINLKSMVYTVRHAVPLMRKAGGGAMVHVSSVQALRGDDKPQDAYQASKAGVIALSKSLAIQLAADGIRSNVLLPGPTESPMQARWSENPQLRTDTAAAIPLQRVGTPEDMAGAIEYLLSDNAAYITGTELIVDGGLLAKP
ncbi:MAG TPA: SDR family oxidoreductase [Gammaproteobacteria bacterium]